MKIHLYANSFLVPSKRSQTQVADVSLPEVYRSQSQGEYQLEPKDLWPILLQHWRNTLELKSTDTLDWLVRSTQVDAELKLSPLGTAPRRLADGRPQPLVLNADELSFEIVMANYFLWGESIWPCMERKLEYLCWEQIIQEISVIRAEANLLIYNRKINQILPKEFQLDHRFDLELQIAANPYLNWLLDAEYRYSNIQYFKESTTLDYVTHFYDSWMVARRQGNISEEAARANDNLKWITDAIRAKKWRELFEANVQRNFGCVYVDNTLINSANQVWASSLYRDYNRKSCDTAKKLAWRESAIVLPRAENCTIPIKGPLAESSP